MKSLSTDKFRKTIHCRIKRIKRENKTLERKIKALQEEVNFFKFLLEVSTKKNPKTENKTNDK